MDPPSEASEEVERFHNYREPSTHRPKWVGTLGRKRPASPTPVEKKPAVAAKRGKTVRKPKPALVILAIDHGTT